MRLPIPIVTISLVGLAFIGGSSVAQDPPETTSRFFNASPEKMRRLVETTTAEEREAAMLDMKRMLAMPEYGKDGLLRALAYLGDEEALQQVVQEFIANDGMGPDGLAAMHNPRIIELVAPEFYREEPMHFLSSDVIIVPRSYRAAELATELLVSSPVFSKEVKEWAGIVRRLSFTERRDLIRPWWRANEQFFREKNYQAVQPGPPPPRVLPMQTVVTVPVPGGTPIIKVVDVPEAMPNPPKTEKSASPSQTPWLGISIAGALALLLAAALYLSTRRRC